MVGRLPRIRIDIDGHSFLESFPDGQAPTLILFVHGILGDKRETWAETPQTLMMFPALADADWGSFGYDTKLIHTRDAAQTLDQLLLWIRTHAQNYKDIFFVTHSMGGLFVRDACARLALSSEPHDWALFSKIKHCFLIASPIGGAVWAKRLAKIPLVCKLNSQLAYLTQAEQYLSRFPTYADAIKIAKTRGGARPKFSVFIGTRDQVVQELLKDVLTTDDVYEGPVPGTHASLKSALTPNSTLVKRIVQIVSGYSLRDVALPRLSEPTISTAVTSVPAGAGPDGVGSLNSKPVILISCSAHKRTDSEILHPKKGGLLSAVADNDVALRAIQTRAQIMGLLQSGKIDGTEYKEGNRAGRPENRALILGPDFGGAINEPRYLPAYRRYSGRTYQAAQNEWISFSNSPDHLRPSLLIMSGLYGLIPFDEYIQNYDCHVTDTDMETGQTVLAYWGGTMTDVLLSHCDRLESHGTKVGPIIDLLSEKSYQLAIDWKRVQGRYSSLHRVFEKKIDRDALVNLGTFLRTLLRDPTKSSQLLPDKFLDEPDFIEPDRIAFECEIGASPLSVARG
jgi:hypothetical protein